MERSKYYISILFLFLAIGTSMASYNRIIYEAYVHNNMPLWKSTLDELNQIDDHSNENLLVLINYHYGYIAWCIGNNNHDEAKIYLKKAETDLKKLQDKNFKPSMTNAYKAAFLGFRIGFIKITAPYLGPKSMDAAKLSLKQNAENWLAYVQNANIQYYMPEIFGGSKTEAIQFYLHALEKIESDEKLTKDNWNYLNLLVIIGEAYTKIGEYKEAKIYYKKIISIEPSFLWVKDELYPDIIQKIKEQNI